MLEGGGLICGVEEKEEGRGVSLIAGEPDVWVLEKEVVCGSRRGGVDNPLPSFLCPDEALLEVVGGREGCCAARGPGVKVMVCGGTVIGVRGILSRWANASRAVVEERV